MKKLRLTDLTGAEHILAGWVPGRCLSRGGLSFKAPGRRTHDTGCLCPSCDGLGRHVHDDSEVFILLQGKARMEIDGKTHSMVAGDVVICEPGEDHHLVSDEEDPCVNLWLHASDTPHENQARDCASNGR